MSEITKVGDELKSLNEIRADLQRLGIARFYYQAVRQMLLRMIGSGTIPDKEPKIEVKDGEPREQFIKRISEKKWQDFYDYHLFRQMLTDRRIMDAYLLGEDIIPKFTTETDSKGKVWKKVKFYPQSAVKKIRVFVDEE